MANSEADDLRIIRDSGFFDAEYYKAQVAIDWSGLDPAMHFLANWRINLASPSPAFSLCRYLAAYPDVPGSGLNPLVHYYRIGKEEKRRIFSVSENFNKKEIFSGLCYHENRAGQIKFNHKRLAILGGYNKDYIIEDYLIYFLEQLSTVVDGIVFVADNYFPFTELLKIRHLVAIFHCQHHGEYDFGSHKIGLALARANNLLTRVDELVLLNDSTYGPVFDFKEVYRQMGAKNVNFWGISHSFVRKEHIQSYYFNFDKQVFESREFKEFYDSIRPHSDVWDVIRNYEVQLTAKLAQAGFSHATLLDSRKLFYNEGRLPRFNPSPYVCKIIESGSPLIKRKALTNPFADNRDGLFRLFATLDQYSPSLSNLMRQDCAKLWPLDPEQKFSLVFIAGSESPESALEAILNQTWRNFELIIVAPGAEIAAGLEPYQRDSRVKMVIAPKGATKAAMYNLGASASDSDWLMYLSENAILDPKCLEYFALGCIKYPDASLFYSQYFKNGDTSAKFGKEFDPEGQPENSSEIHLNAALVKNPSGSPHVFDERLNWLEDAEFLGRLAKNERPQFIECPLVMLYEADKFAPQDVKDAMARHLKAALGHIPKITTIITAWQHEEYITQAIESALMQTGEFAHQILLCDDCSTDQTPEIIEVYQAEYPHLLRALASPINLGPRENLARAIKEADGDYIAFLDGDDRWLTPDKLATQLEFLQMHGDCQLCFGGSYLFDDKSGQSREPENQMSLATFVSGPEILAKNNPVITCSAVMARGSLLRALSKEALLALDDDLGLALYGANFGPLGFIAEKQVAYRLSDKGAWTGLPAADKLADKIARRELILPWLRPELAAHLRADLARLKAELAILSKERA